MNPSPVDPLSVTERSCLRRAPSRACYDRETAHAILDEALVAHLGFEQEGRPFVLPTTHWRDGDRVYWHAAASGRMSRGLVGREVCLTAVLLDGLVLGRAALHHSVNFRSLMLFGRPEEVTDPAEKRCQLERLIERVAPGRWGSLRPMKDNEVKATGILSMPIDEGSAKVRSGPPLDNEEDYGWPVWAGVVPLERRWGAPEPCPRLEDEFQTAAPNVVCVEEI